MSNAKMRIAGIEPESIVDGIGIRYVIFCQGCLQHCDGCHNPETWDPFGGRCVSIESLISEFSSDPLISGITLTGGEPFLQPLACHVLAKAAHERGLSVWCFTGFKFEELQKENAKRLLSEIDVLIDGRFDKTKRTLDLPFRGSSNQRIIHLKNGEVEQIESEE